MPKKNTALNDRLRTHDDITAELVKLQDELLEDLPETPEQFVAYQARMASVKLRIQLLEAARKTLDSRKRFGPKELDPKQAGTPEARPVRRAAEGPFAVYAGGKE